MGNLILKLIIWAFCIVYCVFVVSFVVDVFEDKMRFSRNDKQVRKTVV